MPNIGFRVLNLGDRDTAELEEAVVCEKAEEDWFVEVELDVDIAVKGAPAPLMVVAKPFAPPAWLSIPMPFTWMDGDRSIGEFAKYMFGLAKYSPVGRMPALRGLPGTGSDG